MDLNQIYTKTAKGLEEIQNRTYKLPAHLRRLLIMVDGHSTAAEMIERLTSLGDVELSLDLLSVGGFIAVPTSPSAMSDPRSRSESPAFSLDDAKMQISIVLRGAMGPMAEHRIECVEAAATVEQLRIELDVLRDLLPKVLSKAQAEHAWQLLEPIMLPLERRATARTPEAEPSVPVPPAPPAFNLDKVKGLIRSTLMGAMGPTASHRIELIEAVITPDQLRIELNAICDLLPKVLSKKQADHTWQQLQAIVLAEEQQAAAPTPRATPPGFNMDKAKGFIRTVLLGAMGATAARRIERIEATTSCEQLRVELDSIRDMLPKVLSKREAEQVWRELEPIMLPEEHQAAAPTQSAAPAPTQSAAPPGFDMGKAKGFIRTVLLGAMGPTASRRIERIEATTSCEQLRVELDSIRDMLPKVLSKRESEQVWRQLEPIMLSLTSPL